MANFLILLEKGNGKGEGFILELLLLHFPHRNDAFNILYSFNLKAFLIVSIGSVRNTSQCWVI